MHSPTTSPNSVPLPLPSSARYSHPVHLLKHKYIPTNITQENGERNAMMVDSPSKKETLTLDTTDLANPGTIDTPESPGKKHKKRKRDGEGEGHHPKKQKHDLDSTV